MWRRRSVVRVGLAAADRSAARRPYAAAPLAQSYFSDLYFATLPTGPSSASLHALPAGPAARVRAGGRRRGACVLGEPLPCATQLAALACSASSPSFRPGRGPGPPACRPFGGGLHHRLHHRLGRPLRRRSSCSSWCSTSRGGGPTRITIPFSPPTCLCIPIDHGHPAGRPPAGLQLAGGRGGDRGGRRLHRPARFARRCCWSSRWGWWS